MTSTNKDAVTILLERKKLLKKQALLKKRNKRVFILSLLVFVILFCYLYYYSKYSRINYVIINGNSYLSREDILELAQIDDDDLIVLTFSSLIQKRIMQSPIVDSVTVTKLSDRNIEIAITEKQIVGYTYLDTAYLALTDNSLMKLDSANLDIITKVPLLVDFTEEQLKAGIIDALTQLSTEMLQNIAEIHHYETTYDENMLKIMMNDGNLIFTGLASINVVNNYFNILEVLKVSNSCIYIDESSKTAYSSACPVESNTEDIPEN